MKARIFLNQVMRHHRKALILVKGQFGIKVEDILKVVEIDVLSGKAEVFLVKEDFQLHECSVLFPYPLVGLTLHAIDQLNRGWLVLAGLSLGHSFVEEKIGVSAPLEHSSVRRLKII